jgi:hypothetical protein
MIVGVMFFLWKAIEVFNYPQKENLKALNGVIKKIDIEQIEPEIFLENIHDVYFLAAGLKKELEAILQKTDLQHSKITLLTKGGEPDFVDANGNGYFLIYGVFVVDEKLSYENIKDINININYRGIALGIFLFLAGIVLRIKGVGDT